MNVRTVLLSTAALLALSAPAVAFADPWDHAGGYHADRADDSGRGYEWHGRDWGDHEGWRDHEAWREPGGWRHSAGFSGGWRYGPRCWTKAQGHYTWYGAYVVRPVTVCREG